MSIKMRNLHPEVASRINAAGFALSPNANIIYVDSGHAAAGTGKLGESPNNPISTINAALTVGTSGVTANNGDVIIVMPGHTETISGATDLVVDVDGVSIIGMGRGTDRPTLTFSATDSEIVVSGDNVVLSNMLMTITGAIDVVVGITVSGTDCLLHDIEMREPAATSQWVDAIIGTTCTRLDIDGLIFDGLVAGDATQAAISVTGTPDFITIQNCHIVGEFVAAPVDISGIATNIVLRNLVLQQEHATSDACITVAGTATGFGIDCQLRSATDDDAGLTAIITATNDMQWYNIGMVNANGEHALVSEAADLDVSNTRSGRTFSSIA